MKKKDFKLFDETIRLSAVIIVELIVSILLIRQKKWYSTLAGIRFMVEAGNQIGKANKLLDKTTDRLSSIGFDTEEDDEEAKSDKVQMGFHM